MYLYRAKGEFFAQVPGQMEEICASELAAMGITDSRIAYRGIYFSCPLELLYTAVYTSRLISRVLVPLLEFRCASPADLVKHCSTVAWRDFMTLDTTFAITANVSASRITNSLYAAQVVKDVIADYFNAAFGRRPDVDTKSPDVRFNLHIENEKAVLSLDAAGESLHKRGYRLLAGDAPMQETLAAAIIRISGWNGEEPLWDPMCGSGTILCEALMHYCRVPAQFLRSKFGFFNLPEFRKHVWEPLKKSFDDGIRPLPEGLILGSDKSQRVIAVAQQNLTPLPYSDKVKLMGRPFSHQQSFENGVIITNPPYGIRLGEREEVEKLYAEFGDFLKNRCKGTKAYIYTGEKSLRKAVGLQTSLRVPLVNGKLEGVLLKFESYAGSRKAKYNPQAHDNLSSGK